jgi:RimJ/RimL family protein N-acetyltransferase
LNRRARTSDMNIDTLLSAPAQFSTARLRLERPRPEHAGVVMDSVNASLGALRYVGWAAQAFDAERARRFCARDAQLVAAGECLIYFAFEQDSEAFVGNLDLHSFDFDVPRGEIGYVGDVRRAGSGLMFEAATAVLRLGFELGLERIEAVCDARNLRSIAFAEMLGMTREGLLRSHDRDPQGALCDDVVLSMLRGDPWPSYNRRPSSPSSSR